MCGEKAPFLVKVRPLSAWSAWLPTDVPLARKHPENIGERHRCLPKQTSTMAARTLRIGMTTSN